MRGAPAKELSTLVEQLREPEARKKEFDKSIPDRLKEADAIAKNNDKLLRENNKLQSQLAQRSQELDAKDKQLKDIFSAKSTLHQELQIAQKGLQVGSE